MLDIKYIRENPEEIKTAIKNKQLVGTVDIDELLRVDAEYTAKLQKVETHRALRNQLSENISKVSAKEREKLIKEASKVKEELKEMEEELTPLKQKLDEMMLWVPNPSAADVPIGPDESGNEVVKTEGKIRKFDFEPKTHIELGELLDIVDTERGTKIAGFRGYFLKNEGLELSQAILRYAQEIIKSKGFDVFEVPWMVRPEFFQGTGYFPWGSEDHYKVQDDLNLIGTAEVSLTSYHADEILNEDDLPIKLAGVSPCFRREVGSHGKDTKGIFRVHQFQKVEQVVLVPADEEISREWHQNMLSYSEEVLQGLKLPYQVLLMCTGDMGAGQRKKYDIETWFPAQEEYRETHSDSYFLDFQARRLNMRYKTKDGKTKYVHTLNNTVAAVPRLTAAVLENYQQEDGSVEVPKVLRDYLGKKVIEVKND